MVFLGSPATNCTGLLKHLENSKVFQEADLAWGKFLLEEFSLTNPPLLFTGVMLSRLAGDNHICLKLNYWEKKQFPLSSDNPLVTLPSMGEWLKQLHTAPPEMISLISSKIKSREGTPLMVLDEEGDLYFNKYYYYQEEIVKSIKTRTEEPDRLLIISGGPGTGKTTRVFKEIMSFRQKKPQARIALLAPTGKAASRLREAVLAAGRANESGLQESELVEIADQTQTLHRFLGKIKTSPREWRNWDMVIIDEASMVSFPLFFEILPAIRDVPGLILLGDKNQLSSVEEGSLFYELAGASGGKSDSPLSEYTVFLTRNYRYRDDSDIAIIAEAIRDEKEKARDIFLDCLYRGGTPQKRDLQYFSRYDEESVKKIWKDNFLSDYQSVFNLLISILRKWQSSNKTPKQGVEQLERNGILSELFKLYRNQAILCDRRKGPWGIEKFNRYSRIWLKESIKELQGILNDSSPSNLKPGEPIIVTRNNYELGVYNGDLGVVFPVLTERGWENRFFFEMNEGGYREFSPELLGDWDLAYALTIHKSQGTEYRRVMVLMGNDQDDFVSREMIYTAITRAREKVFFFMEEEPLGAALLRSGIRHSGLKKYLSQTSAADRKSH